MDQGDAFAGITFLLLVIGGWYWGTSNQKKVNFSDSHIRVPKLIAALFGSNGGTSLNFRVFLFQLWILGFSPAIGLTIVKVITKQIAIQWMFWVVTVLLVVIALKELKIMR